MTAHEGWDKHGSPPHYVPLAERMRNAVARAVERHRRQRTEVPAVLSREDKRARAQALREQADALERQP